MTIEDVARIRLVLDQIDNLIAPLHPTVKRGVINVLCALRGPDFDDKKDVKSTTTAVIRSKGLPLTFTLSGSFWQSRFCDMWLTINPDAKEVDLGEADTKSAHFVQHIIWAAECLGLQIRGRS